jgi:hypothetical protein
MVTEGSLALADPVGRSVLTTNRIATETVTV